MRHEQETNTCIGYIESDTFKSILGMPNCCCQPWADAFFSHIFLPNFIMVSKTFINLEHLESFFRAEKFSAMRTKIGNHSLQKFKRCFIIMRLRWNCLTRFSSVCLSYDLLTLSWKHLEFCEMAVVIVKWRLWKFHRKFSHWSVI